MAAIGEDSSGQEMKKKHAVGKDRRRGGMRSRADLNRDRWIQSPAC